MRNSLKPSISVVLPVYNGMAYLKESVESVLQQATPDFNFEFLICDDCSKDESYDFLKGIKDPRVILYKNETNKGLFPTLNSLIKNAKADLVHLWAQDDVMLSNCLKETLKFHEFYPEVNFSFSRLQGIDQFGQLLKSPTTFKHKTLSPEGHAVSSLLYGSISGNIANVCVVKAACASVGYFDENLVYVGDFKMWCVLSKDKPIGMNGNILVHVRQHTGQLSRNLDASFYRMKENYEVYQCFLGTLKPELRLVLERTIQWKIYTTYFNQYLFILKQKRFDLGRKYIAHLKVYESIPRMASRWFIIRILRAFKLEQRFYEQRFYRKIERLRHTA